MATVNQLMNCVLYMSYQECGWSEVYHLSVIDYDQAVPVMEKLAQYRTSLFGRGVKLIWARVSFAGAPHEAKSMKTVSLPLLESKFAIDAGNVPQDPHSAIIYRWETNNGKWANRFWRGIPDNWISDFKLVVAFPLPLPAGQLLSQPNGTTGDWPKYQSSFLRYVLDNTIHAKETVPGTWETNPWTDIKPRKVGKRDTGRPFGQCRGRRVKKAAAPA